MTQNEAVEIIKGFFERYGFILDAEQDKEEAEVFWLLIMTPSADGLVRIAQQIVRDNE